MRIFSSIRSKLISILVILGGLPLLIVGYLSYESASRALLFQTKEQLGNVADKTAQQIDNFFEMARKDVFLLSRFPFIQLSFLQYEFGQRLDTVRRLLDDYSKKHRYLNRIYLVNLKGTVILTGLMQDEKHSTDNFSETEWFQSTLKNGQHLSDVIIQEKNPRSMLILAQTVYDFEDNDKLVGVLAVDIKMEAFTSYVESLKIGSHGYGFLLHNLGYMIYHPDNDLVLGKQFTEIGDIRLENHIKRMMNSQKGFGDYLFKGEEKYLVYTPCRTRNWSVAISVLKSELMAGILRLRQQVITFVSIVLVLIIPVSYLFIRGVTRPIGQLISGASAIGKGDLDQIIDIRSSDELRALAYEFNKMARQLKASMGQILELKAFNEDILRSVSSGIITVNRHNNLTSLNESAKMILHYALMDEDDGAMGEKNEALGAILKLLRATLDGGKKIQHKELTLFHEDEAVKFVDVNTTLLRDREDRVLGAIADIRDITYRKRMEERMVRVDKLASLGELSAGMAHEIRNPLAGLKTSVQVLAKKRTNDSEKILIDGILDEIVRLDKIVTDLLQFSRPSPPVFKAADPLIILEKALDLVSEKMRSNRIKLKRHYKEPLYRVLVDQEQVQQVFLNLLLNSIKAMGDGGDLTITMKSVLDIAKPEDRIPSDNWDRHLPYNFVKIVFVDTGCGIRQEDLPKVFNPFYTTDPGGTGLGLSIAHKLMEKNRGHIYIDSAPGKGTRVTLLLPAVNGS